MSWKTTLCERSYRYAIGSHATRAPTHAAPPGELSGALVALLDDLATSGLAEWVLVLAISEFGRRVAENGSAGTNHAAAGPVLPAGLAIRPGLIGAYPKLDDLDGRLGMESRSALGGSFAGMALLRE